jgi:hypothetical protein
MSPTLCAFALVVSLVTPSIRQSAAADPDSKELAGYTLTMDTLGKIDRAMQAAAADLKKDPRFAEHARLSSELETLQKKDSPTEAEAKRIEEISAKIDALEDQEDAAINLSDAQTLDEMAVQAKKIPGLAAALQREGLTTRDYATCMMALVQAGMAAGLQKAGMLKEVPAGTNPANVKFILDHQAELQKMQEKWQGLSKG